MCPTKPTEGYRLLHIRYDELSDEVTLVRPGYARMMELGFELDDYTMPAALLAYRLEHPADYTAFLNHVRRPAKRNEIRMSPLLIPYRLNFTFSTMEAYRRGFPYTFMEFSPD